MRDVPSVSAAANEFCEWVQVRIDVYILYQKYLAKPYSSPWLSVACAAAIVHRNHFTRFYQKDKSSESNVKFRQPSNCCKRDVEAAKFAYANKTKESSLPRNLALRKFGELPTVFSTKVNLLSASDKAKLFAENCSKNSNIDYSGISLPVFPSRTNLKLHNTSVTPKMLKKVVMNIDLQKASGPDSIPEVVLWNLNLDFLTY